VCFKRSRDGKVEPTACEVLSGPAQTLTLDGCSTWVFANANSLGYYRTAYDSKDLAAFGSALQTSALTPLEQASLIEDVWALVRLNQQTITDFLTLSNQILNAPLSPAVMNALNRVNYISDRLIDAPQRPAFERWVRDTLKPVADKLGPSPTPQESDERRDIRSSVLYTLGYAGRDQSVLNQARRSVDMQLANAGAIDPSLSSTYLRLAAVNGDQGLYDKYVEQMKRASQGGQYQYRDALTYFSDPALQKRTLQFAMSPEVRSQDLPGLLGGLMTRSRSSHDAWDFVKSNWDSLQKMLGVFQGLPTLVESTSSFCDQSTRDDVQRFFEAHPMTALERHERQSLETIDRCIQTRTQQGQSLTAFLR
jgi:aminopeptidase N/puromycin-sensitive aminopeptidase